MFVVLIIFSDLDLARLKVDITTIMLYRKNHSSSFLFLLLAIWASPRGHILKSVTGPGGTWSSSSSGFISSFLPISLFRLRHLKAGVGLQALAHCSMIRWIQIIIEIHSFLFKDPLLSYVVQSSSKAVNSS